MARKMSAKFRQAEIERISKEMTEKKFRDAMTWLMPGYQKRLLRAFGRNAARPAREPTVGIAPPVIAQQRATGEEIPYKSKPKKRLLGKISDIPTLHNPNFKGTPGSGLHPPVGSELGVEGGSPADPS